MIDFDEDEVSRSDRANVALLLHIKPAEVDEMPYQDIADIFARHNANEEIRRKSR